MLAEGIFNARAVKATSGIREKDAKPQISVSFELLDGPDAGKRITWNGLVDEKSKRYTCYALKALGWNGCPLNEAPSQITKEARTVPIEIGVYDPKNGKAPWNTVKVGRRELPDLAAMSISESAAFARELWRAGEEGESTVDSVPPPSDLDAPHDLPF